MNNDTVKNQYTDDADKSMEEELERAQLSSNTTSETFQKAMESVMVVSIAGFGGALAGISIARGRASSISMKKPFIDSNLPNQWAITCMGFATILETVRWISPTYFLLSNLEYYGATVSSETTVENNIKTASKNSDIQHEQAFSKIGDYMIGGAFAGAIFRGASSAKTPKSHTNTTTYSTKMQHRGPKSSPTSPLQNQMKIRTQRMTRIQNIGSGFMLGLLAGCLQYGLFRLELLADAYYDDSLKQPEEVKEDDHAEQIIKNKKDANDRDDNNSMHKDLEQEVKHMSIVELQERIENLKKQK